MSLLMMHWALARGLPQRGFSAGCESTLIRHCRPYSFYTQAVKQCFCMPAVQHCRYTATAFSVYEQGDMQRDSKATFRHHGQCLQCELYRTVEHRER